MADKSESAKQSGVFALFLDNETDRLAKDGTYVTVCREMDKRVDLPAPNEIEIVFSEESIAMATVQDMIQKLDMGEPEPRQELLDIKPGFYQILSGYGGQDVELSFIKLEPPKHLVVTNEWAIILRGCRKDNPAVTITFGPNVIIYLREKGWLLPIEIMEDGEGLKKFLALKGVNVPLKSGKK